MHQENLAYSPSHSKPKSALASQGAPRTGTTPSASQPAESLTAKMLDYRSWWNLPRPRSKKPA